MHFILCIGGKMASTAITNAGVGSGNDFESIITASVKAKRSQYESRTKTSLALAQSTKSGISELKTALSTFQTSCEELTKDNSLNTHKITTNQSSTYNCFTIKAEDDCVNTNFDLTVTQLAKAESIQQAFNTADGFTNSFAAGQITIDLGPEEYTDDNGVKQTRDRTFTVDIQEGDSLELIRKRLNQNDFDLNVSLIKTDAGYSMSINSGSTGKDTTAIKISTSTKGTVDGDHTSLDCFNFDPSTDTAVDAGGNQVSTASSKWNYTEGKDAKILIDGQEVSSHTNTFDEQISGVSLTVNQLSEKETLADGTTGFKSYSVDISTDSDAAVTKMNEIISGFNTLMSKLEELYKRDTYADGKSNYDGGKLAGDSQVKSLQSALQSMVVRFSHSDSGKSIFDCGLEFKSDGTLSLDSTKFKEAIGTSFNSVVNLFTGEDGLLSDLSDYLEDYTQTGGILDERKDQYQDEIDYWNQKIADNEEKLTAYETSLRNKYGNLDSLMSSYQTSMSYISSILG